MQKNSWLLLVVVIALFMGYVVIRTPPMPPPARKSVDLPDWVDAVRRGKPASQDTKSIKAWLDNRLTKGVTTRGDITALFTEPGKNDRRHPINLDRPKRDQTEVFQYTLWESSDNAAYLVFHFDSHTGVLTDWELNYAICGFCPHVFAGDGDWRMEGKMLAGCIGQRHAGTDTLVLPRLRAENGACRVKLANLAPEVDFISQTRLAAVPLRAGEELDVDARGELVIWRPISERNIALQTGSNGADSAVIHLDEHRDADVIVLEVRNSSLFESAMRRTVLANEIDNRDTRLTVELESQFIRVSPVGTKFLRRVAVSLPNSIKDVRLTCSSHFWRVSRVWIGKTSARDAPILWTMPLNDRPLALEPMQHALLEFSTPNDVPPADGRMGYALRLSGYYEFSGTESARSRF